MSVWIVTCRMLARYLAGGNRVDHLLEEAPEGMSAADQRRSRHLLYGTVRHLGLLDDALGRHVRTRPRAVLRAALLLGAFEILEHPESTAVIVHHAVGQVKELTSEREAGLVNAVLRKVGATLLELRAETGLDAVGLARRFSHPVWLVERWLQAWGTEDTLALLAWNQEPAPVHARVVDAGAGAGGSSGAGAEALPAFFRETRFPGYYVLERPEWGVVEQWLAQGRIYIQDPATALAPGLLAARSGEVVLDLCAAPGGKTLHLAQAVGPGGRVVALDLAQPRLERLRANLRLYPQFRVTVVAGDATQVAGPDLGALGLPLSYDAVLLDAPCSNTGVLRHRVDAKWRLTPEDFARLPRMQGRMLRRAAELVRPGGRLVYSTCSLEAEENDGVIEAFLAERGREFVVEKVVRNRPWVAGCDGAGAFLLHRRAIGELGTGAVA